MSQESSSLGWSERLARPPALLTQWVALIVSVLSLTLSSFALIAASLQPDVRGLMPAQVRVAQGGSQGPYLYLQPAFIHTGASQRAEIITDVKVHVEPVGGGAGANFVWNEQGEWRYDPATQEVSWGYLGDPSPFVLSPERAELFTGLFVGPQEWHFAPGAYRLTLTAQRMVGSEPVQVSGEVELTQEQVDAMNSSQGARFLTFPVTARD